MGEFEAVRDQNPDRVALTPPPPRPRARDGSSSDEEITVRLTSIGEDEHVIGRAGSCRSGKDARDGQRIICRHQTLSVCFRPGHRPGVLGLAAAPTPGSVKAAIITFHRSAVPCAGIIPPAVAALEPVCWPGWRESTHRWM